LDFGIFSMLLIEQFMATVGTPKDFGEHGHARFPNLPSTESL